MSIAQTKRFTLDEYHRLTELGFFHEDNHSVSQMDLETVNADLVKIKERLNCLTSLRKIEQQLKGMEQDPDVGGENGLLAKIGKSRNTRSVSTSKYPLR